MELGLGDAGADRDRDRDRERTPGVELEGVLERPSERSLAFSSRYLSLWGQSGLFSENEGDNQVRTVVNARHSRGDSL